MERPSWLASSSSSTPSSVILCVVMGICRKYIGHQIYIIKLMQSHHILNYSLGSDTLQLSLPRSSYYYYLQCHDGLRMLMNEDLKKVHRHAAVMSVLLKQK